jgi:tRNA (guanine-N7-)-methyltransferase
MSKGKLEKFEENLLFPHVFQPSTGGADCGAEYRGKWRERFGNSNPVTLELGCGKGEYTVGLARRNPEVNCIGVDIKGARLWRGAKTVAEQHIGNAFFLRIRIDFVNCFFAPDEVDEIWITFPDPQPKKPRKRLTSPTFIDRYRKFLKSGGTVHLKTDSRALYDYTLEVIDENRLPLLEAYTDIYSQSPENELLQIRTYYETMFAAKKIPITYIKFKIQ